MVTFVRKGNYPTDTPRMKKTVLITVVSLIIIVGLLAGLIVKTKNGKDEAVEGISRTLESDAAGNVLTGFDDEEEIVSIYHSYADENNINDPYRDKDIIEELVMLYGSQHFPSVDAHNKVDMAGAKYLTEFCEKVSRKESGKQTLIAVDSPTRIIRYGFETESGNVDVHKIWYEFSDGDTKVINNVSFAAENWNVDDSYLLFEGSYYSDVMYALTMSDGMEHDAIRIAPLDPECRRLSEIYALRIGYERNNIFLTDWDANEFSKLDLDDIFEYACTAENVGLETYLYEADEYGNQIYYIPESVYEEAIQSIVDIGSEQIKSWHTYNPCTCTYGFRRRGIEEAEVPEYPSMEVTSCEHLDQGRIRLTVNAIYPEMNTDHVLTSEVIVREASEGSYVICSNKVIHKDETKLIWHADRIPTKTSYAEDFVISAEDIAMLNEKAVAANDKFSDGNLCTVQNGKMNNGNLLEQFVHDYEEGRDAEAEVYTLREDGTYSMTAFLCKGGKLNTYFANVEKNNSGKMLITVHTANVIDSLVLTEKGYFIYGLRYLTEHASSRNFWRIYPADAKCEEYTDRFVKGMNFITYELFIKNWNEDNVNEVLSDGLFDDLYRKETGEVFKPVEGKISGELFERIMMKYLPVSIEQLRSAYECHKDSKTYAYRPVYPGTPNIPFGEVVDVHENADGTLDLVVDGVCVDYDSDCGFRCYVKVRPYSSGGFMYLSNRVEARELSIPKLSIY
ncbi:MAG: DUF6070 family protein [Lachnospiraceae bacterium]|nr:DUF6070 family protein [Lachnospiraceae bacterium]